MDYYDKFRKLTPEEEAERDQILFGEYDTDAYGGGIRRFCGLTPEGMETLISKGYADPDERQNDCPSISEVLEFCKRHPGFTMHGYAVSRERRDCRVSVEGVEANGGDVPTDGDAYKDIVVDFAGLFRWADDFQIGGENSAWYCWFD